MGKYISPLLGAFIFEKVEQIASKTFNVISV